MSTFDMNNATDVALKMDVYTIYLRKSRADLEAEKLGEGETLARHRKILEELGGTGKLGYAKRRERGIRIVGKKKKSS